LQGRCLYANPASLAILGRSLEEASGEGWLECISAKDRERMADLGMYGFDGQVSITRKDGDREIWIRLYRTEEGGPRAIVGTLADVTERRRVEQEWVRARDAAEAAS